MLAPHLRGAKAPRRDRGLNRLHGCWALSQRSQVLLIFFLAIVAIRRLVRFPIEDEGLLLLLARLRRLLLSCLLRLSTQGSIGKAIVVIVALDLQEHVVVHKLLSSVCSRSNLQWFLILLDALCFGLRFVRFFQRCATRLPQQHAAKAHRPLRGPGLLWTDEQTKRLCLLMLLQLLALTGREAPERGGVPIVVELVVHLLDLIHDFATLLLEGLHALF
mmetsp:Transcript_70339/g.150630  ORF Transcript_70339/g.150630 Transcript_70339/m.150630 type:complete len:218 (+) Transcript_70339:536-1189(+)